MAYYNYYTLKINICMKVNRNLTSSQANYVVSTQAKGEIDMLFFHNSQQHYLLLLFYIGAGLYSLVTKKEGPKPPIKKQGPKPPIVVETDWEWLQNECKRRRNGR